MASLSFRFVSLCVLSPNIASLYISLCLFHFSLFCSKSLSLLLNSTCFHFSPRPTIVNFYLSLFVSCRSIVCFYFFMFLLQFLSLSVCFATVCTASISLCHPLLFRSIKSFLLPVMNEFLSRWRQWFSSKDTQSVLDAVLKCLCQI